MIKLSILGADGFMGQLITKLALQDKEFQIIHAYTIPSSPNLGKDLGVLSGYNLINVPIVDTAQFETDCKSNPPDVIIDFTVAKGTEVNGIIAAKLGLPIVIGTTGLSNEFNSKFDDFCKAAKGSAVISSNMAIGMNVYFKIAAEIAKELKGWDIEIIEAHHHRKRDSPSGTALTIAKNIAEAIEKNLDEIAKFGRPNGPSPRKIGAEEIGIHAIRAGDIVGDHTVLYAGPGERIELVHRAHSRECFASGAVKAAKFLAQKPKDGTIYYMQDVLGLK